MRERPILFSAPMVRAILDGRKTQTRRIANKMVRHPDLGNLYKPGALVLEHEPRHVIERCCPYGQPGDRLYVKEAVWMWCERRPNGATPTGRQKWRYEPMLNAAVFYAADHPEKPSVGVVSPDTGNQWGWRLKIGRFMPKWASRITLEITAVRVERLQDISEADAIAEGAQWAACGSPQEGSHKAGYAKLWESLNGAGSWPANPWVWVVEFRRIRP